MDKSARSYEIFFFTRNSVENSSTYFKINHTPNIYPYIQQQQQRHQRKKNHTYIIMYLIALPFQINFSKMR